MGRFQDIMIGDPDRYNYGSMCVPNVPCMNQEKKKVIFYTKGTSRWPEQYLPSRVASTVCGYCTVLLAHLSLNNSIFSYCFSVDTVPVLLAHLSYPIATCSLRYIHTDEPIPIFLAAIMGLQHAFAMVGGLITVPFVIFKFTICFICVDLQQYAIAAALITSGICTWINISKIPIPYTKEIMGRQMYIGTGILSVMGTSFTFLPIYEIAIQQQIDDGVEGTVAYGRMLGTSMVCGLLELGFSFMPLHWITTIFPPIVTSITVILIGVALTGTGMKYWGGGAVCADMVWKEHDQVVSQDLSFPPPFPSCQNGEVSLGFGAPQFIGLGFSVIVALVVIELFGSTFMKYVFVIMICMIDCTCLCLRSWTRHSLSPFTSTSGTAT
jgi:xanthine/uracil permease